MEEAESCQDGRSRACGERAVAVRQCGGWAATRETEEEEAEMALVPVCRLHVRRGISRCSRLQRVRRAWRAQQADGILQVGDCSAIM